MVLQDSWILKILSNSPLNDRFRINPYPVVNFGTLAICTEKTMYLNIENIGRFPLRYSVQLIYQHPSVIYMTKMLQDDFGEKMDLAEKRQKPKKGKKSSRNETEYLLLFFFYSRYNFTRIYCHKSTKKGDEQISK